MRRIGFDQRPFNVVASCAEFRSSEALAALAAAGEFRATPYRAVLVGWVEGDPADTLAAAWARAPETFADVVRISPLERVAAFERDDVTEELCCMLESRVGAVTGRSFYVRARLRGMKGRLEAQAVERALGAFLIDAAARAEAPARVRFDDPDVILVVEVIGKRVGYGFVERGARSVPVMRPR